MVAVQNYQSRYGRAPPEDGREEKAERDGATSDKNDETEFRNYALPARLVFLELLVFIFLVILLGAAPEAGGISTLSGSTGTGVGLLRTCNDADCGGWLGGAGGGGAGAGGSGGASKAGASTESESDSSSSDGESMIPGMGARHLHVRQSGPTSSTSSSDSSSQTDPATFHLTIGLAAICLFYMIGFALFFHTLRWLKPEPPPAQNPDPDDQDDWNEKTTTRLPWYRKPTTWFGIKRFGYRVSRVYTFIGHILLIAVTIAAVMQAMDSTVGTGAVLLVIACIFHVPVVLIELVGRRGRIGRWLYCFSDRKCGRCGDPAKTPSSKKLKNTSVTEQFKEYQESQRRVQQRV